MSAFDLLSPKQQDAILAQGREQTRRIGELAARALDECGFVDRLGTYMRARLPVPERDDTDALVALRAQLCDALKGLRDAGRDAG